MINVYNANEYTTLIERAVKGALKHFNIARKEVEVEIELIESAEMQELNNEARGIDAVTDVLSFPSLEVKLPFNVDDYPMDVDPESGAVLLGEIYICFDRAKEQAEEYGHSIERELGFLATHGMLHLLGYDHIEESDEEEMTSLAERIMDELNLKRN